MSKLTIANLKKTIYYFQRNGLRSTWNAARERLSGTEHYAPELLTAQQKQELQKKAEDMIKAAKKRGDAIPFFSILVPAYRTDPVFLRELVQSVRDQVYSRWELLILDASEDGRVREALGTICGDLNIFLREESVDQSDQPAIALSADDSDGRDGRRAECVRYLALPENAGISENTNAGLPLATGDYIGLLDHDDVLTAETLYEMARAILGVGQEHGRSESADGRSKPSVLYSDEDKWDGENKYYELNRKEDFNFDLLLSNNYICHFLVMRAEFFRMLRLRKEYDGAQDYDLVLRAVAKLLADGQSPEENFCHIPKVLYHWRCHGGSTAENPQSKTYAYEAGKRALQDFADGQGWNAVAKDLKHVGFYRLSYPEGILKSRPDIGAVGGRIMGSQGGRASREKVLTGGRMAADGCLYYEGLKEGFSGYLHRGVLTQDAEAVDLRCILVAEEFWPLFEQVVGVPYTARRDRSFESSFLPENADIAALGTAFGMALRERGKRILWDPDWVLYLQ